MAEECPAEFAVTRRICIVCSHEECPGCDDWCDTLIHVDGDSDIDLCCDERCTYVPELPHEAFGA